MKFVILEPIGIIACKYEQLRNEFEELGHELVFFSDRNEDEEELIKRAEGADVIVVSNIPINYIWMFSCSSI